MSLLPRLLERIAPPDPRAGERARQRLDRLAKPPGSLGRLEELAWRLALGGAHAWSGATAERRPMRSATARVLLGMAWA